MTTANSQLLERIQALEDEVNLLKTEIRQVLIDMRDTWLKRSDVLSVGPVNMPVPVTSPADVSPQPVRPITDMSEGQARPAQIPQPVARYSSLETGLDMSIDSSNKGIVNDLLEWMGDAKEKGLTAARLFPILEAYETSGMMSPLMAKFILKSMSMLDEIQTGEDVPAMSPSSYSESISDLHKLVCISIDSS
ncbi:uncharacterized protein METZ01_LOCUS129608 [marine metagenome]|uniref:Uncharacterized protein n=1 Tax=marine metagenome TaxID=408172 RepID=A0A381YIA9_9ZZZZ|tara:strand:- start:21 stop:596 length:576 start_codon:yes stop_codon:yes gene_type:complete